MWEADAVRQHAGSAEKGVQFPKSLFEHSDVFRGRRLELPLIVFIDVRDFAGLYGLEKLYQPIALLMPVFRAHNALHVSRDPLASAVPPKAREDFVIIGDVLDQHPHRLVFGHPVCGLAAAGADGFQQGSLVVTFELGLLDALAEVGQTRLFI